MPGMRKAGIVLFVVAAARMLFAAPAAASPAGCEAVGVNPFDPPRLSSAGSVIAFATTAQLVPADQNGTLDVYVQDVRGGDAELISVRPGGRPGFGRSGAPSISADGRYVAFESDTATLTPDDDIGITDVFVRDRVAETTTLISVTPKGRSGNRESSRPDINSDGTQVAFQSFANDLTKGDGNALYDVYVRDLKRRTTTLVSVLPGGAVASNVGSVTPAISDNGLVVFDSSEAYGPTSTGVRSMLRDDNFYMHAIILRDLRTGKARVVSNADDGTLNNGLSYRPDISSSGRYVSFESTADNLVDGDTNNSPALRGIGEPDVFVRDLKTGRLRRASVASDGTEGNGTGSSGSSITNAGLVAYESSATSLAPRDDNAAIDVFLNSSAGRTVLVSSGGDGSSVTSAGYLSFGSVSPSLAAGGKQIAFASSAPELTYRKGRPLVFGAFMSSRHAGGKLHGPFGIGCRYKTFSVPASGGGTQRRDATTPMLAASAVLAAAFAASRRPRARLAAAIALCIGATSIAVPASAHHHSPIQPGGPILFDGDLGVASTDFVFRDRRTKALYIGTAAHVTRGMGAGSEVPMEGVGMFGRLAYSREGMNAFSRQDVAIVRIHDRLKKHVDPSVRTWGGPTGVADPTRVSAGELTYLYGQALVFRHTQATRGKVGVLSPMIEDDWGWMGWFDHTTWTFGGDSGSPVLTGDGKGLGITSGLSAPYGEPGYSMGPTLALIMQELRLVGFDLELVTAPFDGLAGGTVATIEHCAAAPVDETAQNEGCVRPYTGP